VKNEKIQFPNVRYDRNGDPIGDEMQCLHDAQMFEVIFHNAKPENFESTKDRWTKEMNKWLR
jgi:hypothetical protein